MCMKMVDYIIKTKLYFKRAFSSIKRRITPAPRQPRAMRAEGRFSPPVPSGRGALIIVVDILLVLAVAASSLWCLTTVFKEDERITVYLQADDSGSTDEYFVFAKSVGEFIDEAGVVLGEGDELSHELSEPLENGMTVSVTRAYPVAVSSMGKRFLLKMTGGTVGEALREAGVTVTADDELSAYAFSDLYPGMQIVHDDLEVQYSTTYKTLSYREETIKDESMYEGESKLVQEGADGEKQVTQRIVIRNGVETSREVVDQVVIIPSVDEITKVGAKIRYQSSWSGEFRRWKKPPTNGEGGWSVMYVEATAYCTGTKTSTGAKPKLGVIAVNPKIIPYYTQIYVPGYGYGKALDTGAFRNYEGGTKNQIDIWLNTERECRRWGRKRNFKIFVKL